MLVRLNKFLSQAGAASRREADRMIAEGRISVNGRVIQRLGVKIDDEKDKVDLDGRRIKMEDGRVYILLHKPAGIVVSLKDPLGRTTVKDLLPGLKTRVFPVGRLDAASSGVLLLTNDGPLSLRLTHPKYEVWKTYLAKVKGVPAPSDLAKLRKGIFLEGRKTAPARFSLLSRSSASSLVRIGIREGRKREIRKMFLALGYEVAELRRIDFAGLTLERLKPGQWRFLDVGEVRKLKKLAGMTEGSRS